MVRIQAIYINETTRILLSDSILTCRVEDSATEQPRALVGSSHAVLSVRHG